MLSYGANCSCTPRSWQVQKRSHSRHCKERKRISWCKECVCAFASATLGGNDLFVPLLHEWNCCPRAELQCGKTRKLWLVCQKNFLWLSKHLEIFFRKDKGIRATETYQYPEPNSRAENRTFERPPFCAKFFIPYAGEKEIIFLSK